jgi:hypothetical protein
MCYISVTVPSSSVNSHTENNTISVAGSAAQIFLIICWVYLEVMFLIFMTKDGNVAIFQPLHYPIIMYFHLCTTESGVTIQWSCLCRSS